MPSNKYAPIVEKHPPDYHGYPFITLIEYNKTNFLTVVDNCTEQAINCYVLDRCSAENVDEMVMIQAAMSWYSNMREMPLSVAISRAGLTKVFEGIMSTFQTEYVTRVVGPLPQYNFTKVQKVRRRRKRSIGPAIKIVDKTLKDAK